MSRGLACLFWLSCLLKGQTGCLKALQGSYRNKGIRAGWHGRKERLPGERDLSAEGHSRVWWGCDCHNASSVTAAELQGQPSGPC